MKNKMSRAGLIIAALATAVVCAASAAANPQPRIVETDDRITVSVFLNSYHFSRSGPAQHLSADGFDARPTPGHPGIVFKSMFVEIPDGCQVSIDSVSETSRCLENITLGPVPKREWGEGPDGVPVVRDTYVCNAQVYSQQTPYPGRLAEIAETARLRGRNLLRVNVYPFQYTPATETLVVHEAVRVTLRLSRAPADNTARSNLNRLIAPDRAMPDPFGPVYRRTIMNYDPQRPVSGAAGMLKRDLSFRAGTMDAISASPFAIKMHVRADGLYRVTYDDLATMGVPLGSITHENLAVSCQGTPVAVWTGGTGAFQDGDELVFFGQAFTSRYTNVNTYWLYLSSADAVRMQTRAVAPAASTPTQTVFQNVYRGEENHVYWQNPPTGEASDHWFWAMVSSIEEETTYSCQFQLANLDETAGPCSLELLLHGKTSTGHVQVSVNGMQVDDFTWSGQEEITRTIDDIPAAYLMEGENTLTVEAVDDSGGQAANIFYLNSFVLSYYDTFVAEDDQLRFTVAAGQTDTWEISGFTTSDIALFDVADHDDLVRLTGAATAAAEGRTSLRLTDSCPDGCDYITAGTGAYLTPAEMIVDVPSNLASSRSDVDYIVITHADFYDAAQELTDYRASFGLSCEIALIEDIYDEFSHGIKDVTAVRSFLSHAYRNWHAGGHPTYVVLAGDASIDYRDDYGYAASEGNVDFVPTALFQTSILGDTATDNWFACVDGDDYLPDMLLGRIGVKTAAELDVIVEKIKDYEAQEPEAWNANMVFAADAEPLFESISDGLAAMMPEGYTARKVYVSEYAQTSQATDDLIDFIDAGALILNYTGHGHIDEWDAPSLFQTPDDTDSRYTTRNDVEKLSNRDKLPLVLVMNCLSGFFPHWQDRYSMTEEFLVAENKGAVACFASTSSGYPSEHQVLGRKIFSGLFSDNMTQIGPLLIGSKIEAYQSIYSRDLIETFTLFGDPAMQLQYIPPSLLTTFTTLNPAANEVVPRFPVPQFSWKGGIYNRFKLQFSPDETFPVESTITVPLLPFVMINRTTYRPPLLIWAIISLMERRAGAMYWQVAAYDENLYMVGTTRPAQFSIAQ